MESQCERCNKRKKVRLWKKRMHVRLIWHDFPKPLRQAGNGTVRLLIPDLSKDARPCLLAGGFFTRRDERDWNTGRADRERPRWGHSFQPQRMRPWKNVFSKTCFLLPWTLVELLSRVNIPAEHPHPPFIYSIIACSIWVCSLSGAESLMHTAGRRPTRSSWRACWRRSSGGPRLWCWRRSAPLRRWPGPLYNPGRSGAEARRIICNAY